METPPSYRHSKRTQGTSRGSRRSSGSVFPLILLLILLAVVGASAIYLLTSRSVNLVVDGSQYSVRTYQPTIRDLFAELDLSIHEEDIISPQPDTAVQSGMTITIDKVNRVIIEADGNQETMYTRLTDPDEILHSTGIILNSGDLLLVDNQPFHADESYSFTPNHLRVVRELPVQVNDNGITTTLYTTRRTVGEILDEADLALYAADQIEPEPSTKIAENMLITIKRSVPIRVIMDGRTLQTRTHGKAVNTALAEVGIALVGLDYTIPETSSPVTENMSIQVVRVTEEDIVQHSPIPFERSIQADPTLPIDTQQVIQQGKDGIQEIRIRIRREDDVEVSRSEPEYFITQQPRNEITAVGTLPVIKTLDTPDGTIEYWRVIKMRSASYKPSSTGKSSDDPTYGITASGEMLRKGIVAVDPDVIPLGSMVYVPGYGKALAADTGGAVKGLVIDLGYSDQDNEAWSGEVEVYLLAPAPAPEDVPLLQEAP